MSSSFLPITKNEGLPKLMLIDMNSFFASVEQQANPRFREKPLGVCASLHETSCLIAASKEAKKLGIKTGTLVYKAKKIYPKIILVSAEPEKYREVNRRINKIFESYTNQVQGYSIDESFLDLSGTKLNPLLVGGEIKKRIRQEVGEWLTCSVGVASNKFMAKLAADLEKPDGLSVVWRKNLPDIYKYKKFTDLWGIARGWTNRLNRLGIMTPLQMLSYPVANLLAAFGKPGFYIWQRVNGLEIDVIPSNFSSPLTGEEALRTDEDENANQLPKSFGHSWVLNFRTTNKEKLKIVIMRLAEKAARRMRREGFKSCGVYLSVTLVTGSYFHISKKLKRFINTGTELYSEALNLWKNWEFTHDAMHIAVGFNYLAQDSLQLDLFDNKNPDLIKALDAINDRYGEFTIRSGILTNTQNFAPDAIAFGR